MTTGSTTTSSRSREAQAYLDGVGAALADLPEDDRADLLDELATHLDELAAEGDGPPLVRRLGSPEEYAAELRASAGLPPARTRGRSVAEALARLLAHRRSPAITGPEELLHSLRPAWWVLRAWVCVALFTWYAQPHWWRSLVIVPDVGPDVLSVLVLLAAIVVSVQVGRRGRLRTSTATWLVALFNLVAALGLWPVLLTLNEAVQYGAYNYYGDQRQEYVEQVTSEGIYAAGRQVRNIYAYDATGRLLPDTRLYDQKGRPLELGDDREIRQAIDAAGQPVRNAFPYRYLDSGSGAVLDQVAPPFVVPPLVVLPDATATPSPTPTPTPSPSSKSGKR